MTMKALRTIGLAAMLAACDDVSPEVANVDATRLTWELAWDTDGTSLIDGTRVLQTDLGYVVALEDAWLTTYSAQLVACAAEGSAQSRAEIPRRVRDTLVALVVPHAWAGHSDSSDSTTAPGIIENVVAADTIVLADRAVADDRYCRVHYLVARSDDEVDDPEGVALDRVSLRLRGRWSVGDGATGAFDLESSLATGAFVDLAAEIDVRGPWTVTVQRPLATLLDGIELDAVSSDALARAVLRTLADELRVEVRRR